LTNLKLNHNTTTGIVISNQWATAGGAPGALPTENINIFNLDVTGGPGTQTAQSIIDNLNGNTLTNAAGGNGAVGYYLFGLNGVMTSAKPESGLINAFDINGQTTAIYNGGSNPVFSAAPSGAGTGAVSTSHYVGVQATGPSCFFTSGGGLNSGCTLDAGSTDSVGTIIHDGNLSKFKRDNNAHLPFKPGHESPFVRVYGFGQGRNGLERFGGDEGQRSRRG
jgi:hypothetical protein